MFRLRTSETQPLTRELVDRLRNMQPSPTEREFSGARLRHLHAKAKAGLLVNFHWVTARLPNGDEIRMNGQHSSRMLSELNGEFPTNVLAHIDHYDVDDENGLALLFRQYDDRRSGRSPADVAGAYQGIEPALRGIPRNIAKIGIEAVAWWCWNIEGLPTPSGDDVYSMFNDARHHPFLQWIGSFLGHAPAELKRVSIVAAMFATFRANAVEARIFWSNVADGGVEYEDNAPATILAEGLKLLKENPDPRKPVKALGLYHGGVYAWNAYREGKPLRKISFDAAKGKPVIIPKN